MNKLFIICLCVFLHTTSAISFNQQFSIPDDISTITMNQDSTYTVTINQPGWVASDIITAGTNANFYAIIESAPSTVSVGIILLDTTSANSGYRDCSTDSGYNFQSSLVGLSNTNAPCSLADVATIYFPVTPVGSTTGFTAVAPLRTALNFELNYYEGQPCVEVVIIGVQTINAGGSCDSTNAGLLSSDPSLAYGAYFELADGNTVTYTVGTSFACPANCTACDSPTTCQTCAIGFVLNGTQCVPVPPSPPTKPTCSPSCKQCDYNKNVTVDKKSYYVCKKCSPGQYFSSNMYECSSCPSSCTSCTSENKCQTCAPGYQLINSQCVKPTCSPTCAYCDFSQVISNFFGVQLGNLFNQYALYACSVCPRGYYLKSNRCECQPCPKNCASCTNGGICLSCKPGYIPFNFKCRSLGKRW